MLRTLTCMIIYLFNVSGVSFSRLKNIYLFYITFSVSLGFLNLFII